MAARLFVYGTLAPGQPNAHVLEPLKGRWTPAIVRGHLYPEGWGAAAGYPGLRLDPQGAEIPGLLFEAPGLGAFWPELDAFEGEGYRRVVVMARIHGTEWVDAWVYELA